MDEQLLLVEINKFLIGIMRTRVRKLGFQTLNSGLAGSSFAAMQLLAVDRLRRSPRVRRTPASRWHAQAGASASGSHALPF